MPEEDLSQSRQQDSDVKEIADEKGTRTRLRMLIIARHSFYFHIK